MKSNDRELPPAVVLGGGHNALGIFRSLGRKGVKIIAIHSNRDAALLSRFCTPVAAPCDPAFEEEKYVDFLSNLPAFDLEPPVLIATGDSEVLALSRQRSRLQRRFRYIMPEHAVVETLIDKGRFARLAEHHGVPAPRSYDIESAPLEELSRQITYPCVIKPALSRAWGTAAFQRRFGADAGGWIKRIIVRSRDELLRLYPELLRFERRLVIQQYIEGGDDALYDFYSYLDENSDPLGCFMIRKMRTLPIDGNGIGTSVESVWNDGLAEMSLRFLKAIRYRGNSAVSFKRCARTGRFYVIEVNARLAVHHSLATACGVDVSYMAYLEAIGEKPARATAQQRNVRWLSLWDDFAAYRRYRKRGDLKFSEWIRSLKGAKTHCYFAWDDLRPFALKTAEALLAESVGRERVRRLLGAARRRALRLASYTGVLWLTLRIRKKPQSGLLVLMYHSIGESGELDPDLCVSKQNFAKQLRYLKHHCHVISLEDAVERLHCREPLPDDAVAITFDDGFRDNYEAALPLLREYGCPATFFVSTGPLDDRRPLWPNQLYLWLTTSSAARFTLPEALLQDGQPNAFELESRAQRKTIYRAVEQRMWQLDNAERKSVLASIAAQLGFSNDENPGGRLQMLTWPEVKRLAEEGMTIGSHTVTHPVLSSLSGEEILEELASSKAALEQRLGRRVMLFAYPFGGLEHFDGISQSLVERAGYKAAFTTLPGINEAGVNRWALKRVGVQDDPPSLFAFKLFRLQN